MQKRIKLGKSKSISFLKLPFDFFETHFQKLSPGTVKMYLYILYLCTLGDVEINDSEICRKLNLTLKDMSNAYSELRDVGLLTVNDAGDEELVNLEEFYKNFTKNTISETKKEIKEKAKSIKFDNEFKKKISFIEDVYRKELTQNDILEIYDLLNNQKVAYDVLICAIEYSLSKNIKSLNYVAKIAINWKELGLNSYESCEKYISGETFKDDNLYVNICKMFNIKRELYDVEKKYIDDWYYNHKKTLNEIKQAFDLTIINTGKLAFPYLNSILIGEKKEITLKSDKKKNELNNFTEREYDYDDVLSALRKKQNG